MKDWDYENEQWTKLPTYLKHLPLFTRHIDMFSVFMRFLWSIFLKNLAFKFYIRLQVKGTPFKEIYRTQPKLIIISNHASHLDAVSIAASIPRRYWLNLYIAAAKDYFFSNGLFTFFSKHCLGAIPIDRKDRRGEAINLILKLLTELPRMWLIFFPKALVRKTGKFKNSNVEFRFFPSAHKHRFYSRIWKATPSFGPRDRPFLIPENSSCTWDLFFLPVRSSRCMLLTKSG